MDKEKRKEIAFHWLKKLLPRTLFARSLLIIVIPVLVLQIVTTIVFVDNHWRKITTRMAFSVAGEIAIIADNLDKNRTPANIKEITDSYSQKLDLLVTFEPNETLVAQNEIEGLWGYFTANTLTKAMERQVRRPFTLIFSPQDDWVNIRVQLESGILRVLALDRRLYSSSASIFLMWVLGTSIILFAISVFFMRNQIRPIRALAVMADKMGKGQEIPNFKPEGAKEVRQATKAFIDMHQRITRQVEQRTAMLAGVSHDLRTPLTRIKLGLSLIDESQDIKDLKNDVADMERMINSYLSFLRGDGDETTQSIILSTLINKIAEASRRQGKNIHIDVNPSIIIDIRPLAFERALQNLVSNSEKYGDDIWISVKEKLNEIVILIDDNGAGLSPTLFEEVFKPFFRGDEARNISTGSVGLGLPIVRDIIHAHGGEVHLEKSPKGGLRAVITLPI